MNHAGGIGRPSELACARLLIFLTIRFRTRITARPLWGRNLEPL